MTRRRSLEDENERIAEALRDRALPTNPLRPEMFKLSFQAAWVLLQRGARMRRHAWSTDVGWIAVIKNDILTDKGHQWLPVVADLLACDWLDMGNVPSRRRSKG